MREPYAVKVARTVPGRGVEVIPSPYSTIFNSLKNEIEIKPLRVWTDNSIYGALIIGFIAQLFISLMRYEIAELKHTSTKFIKKSLSDLTVTVDSWGRKVKRYVYSNFDAINTMVLRLNWGVS
jgi:Transposase